MTAADAGTPPILEGKDPAAPSLFTPEALLHQARRQRGGPAAEVPAACLLDPDGDIVRHLARTGRSRAVPGWACYHTEMAETEIAGRPVGIVGCAVGAPFAVLVAEQMFASGCRLLVSVTSAGRLADLGAGPSFVLIERALRDEGTSYHYAAPALFADADPVLIEAAFPALRDSGLAVRRGGTWTTDAPYRETAGAIERARGHRLLAVEMEAAALYAFAAARRRRVLCLAHVTNAMGQAETDFEKGESDGAVDALRAVAAVLEAVTALP